MQIYFLRPLKEAVFVPHFDPERPHLTYTNTSNKDLGVLLHFYEKDLGILALFASLHHIIRQLSSIHGI